MWGDLKARVRLTRNSLNEAIRSAKKASWGHFVEKPLRRAQLRSQQSQVMPAITSNGQECLTVVDSVTALVSEMFRWMIGARKMIGTGKLGRTMTPKDKEIDVRSAR